MRNATFREALEVGGALSTSRRCLLAGLTSGTSRGEAALTAAPVARLSDGAPLSERDLGITASTVYSGEWGTTDQSPPGIFAPSRREFRASSFASYRAFLGQAGAAAAASEQLARKTRGKANERRERGTDGASHHGCPTRGDVRATVSD